MKTWLWLEDQPETVTDFQSLLSREKFRIRRYKTPGELINDLVDWKEKNPKMLQEVGFILDVLLMANPFITCPKEWCGGEKTIYFPTAHGYHGGLVFCEKIILGVGIQNQENHVWRSAPPPIMFLTELHTDSNEEERQLAGIKQQWATTRGVDINDAKVDWIRKWDRDHGPRLVERLKEWEE